MYMVEYEYIYILRPEVNIRYSPLLLSILFLERVSLNELGTHILVKMILRAHSWCRKLSTVWAFLI